MKGAGTGGGSGGDGVCVRRAGRERVGSEESEGGSARASNSSICWNSWDYSSTSDAFLEETVSDTIERYYSIRRVRAM